MSCRRTWPTSTSLWIPPAYLLQRGLSQKRLAQYLEHGHLRRAQLPLPPDKGTRCEAHTWYRLGHFARGGDLHRRRHLCRQPELARRCCGTGGVPPIDDRQAIPAGCKLWQRRSCQ